MNGRRGSVTSTSRRTGLFGTSTPHVRARSPERPPAALTTASALTSSPDRKSTRLNSSHLVISYAVFCLKKKKERQSTIHSVVPLLHDNDTPTTIDFMCDACLLTVEMSIVCHSLYYIDTAAVRATSIVAL